MTPLGTHADVRIALGVLRRQPLLAGGVSVWCTAVLATTIAAPNVPGGLSRALGIAAAPQGQAAVAGAQAGGGAPAGASAETAQVQGITVDSTLGATLTADGGADGVPPRLVVTRGRPGSVGVMQLRVSNTGDRDADLELSRGVLDDLPGVGGGVLSRRLELVITDPESGVAHWSGMLGDFAKTGLGSVAAGGMRRWHVELRFLDGGAHGGDNAYQGAGVAATYVLGET
jgi:hypothetical protein